MEPPFRDKYPKNVIQKGTAEENRPNLITENKLNNLKFEFSITTVLQFPDPVFIALMFSSTISDYLLICQDQFDGIFHKIVQFRNYGLLTKPGRKRSKRIISANGGLEPLQMVSEPDTG